MFLITLVGYFAAGAVLNTFAHWIGLYSWRKAQHAHWTERARLLWPVRVTAITNVIVLPVLIHQVHDLLWTENSGWWFAYMFAGCLGALLGTYPLETKLFPNLTFRTWTSLSLGWWGIRLGGWISLIATMIFMPPAWGWGTLLTTLAYLLFNFFVLSGAATRILLLAGCLKESDPSLERLLQDAAPLILVLLMFLLARFARTLSVEFEGRADSQAVTDQLSEGVYARALEKLYEANQAPAVTSKKPRTHPHLYDRLIAAGVTPSYPRPPAPSGMTWIGRLYALAMLFLLGLTIARDTSQEAPSSADTPSRPSRTTEFLPNPTHESPHIP